MSNGAITWALAQRIPHSSAKFVLVVLANYASEESAEAFPSIASISEATGQDRKTVMANLGRLRDQGLITDAGRRGRTGQVVVYRLNIPKNGTVSGVIYSSDPNCGLSKHYVYRLFSPQTGQFYVGVRSCVGDPDKDSYMGSGRWPSACAASGVNLQKEIVAVLATRDLADAMEQELINSALGNPLCMNSPKTGTVQTVPKTDTNGTVFPHKESRFSAKQSQKRNTDTSDTKAKDKKKAQAPVLVTLTAEELVAEGLDASLANDFLAHRKKKRAELTPRAWGGFKREAEKAGWSLADAVEKTITRNWISFEASWVEKPTQAAGSTAGAGRSGVHIGKQDYSSGWGK